MREEFTRTCALIGEGAMTKLENSRVIVFGAGGVGGYVLEAIARSGVGAIDIADGDSIALSNVNRQILATHSTIGKNKAEAAAARILSVNPACKVKAHPVYFSKDTEALFDFSEYSYVVDAIDNVTAKLRIIELAKENNVPVISCMGTGNKLDPSSFKIADIEKTDVCPLARVMRRELRKRGIKCVKCLYSTEEPINSNLLAESGNKRPPASIAFVPSVAGLMIAAEVIKDLIK